MNYDITIVGGGPAGLSAAIAASKGTKTILIEKDDGIGVNVRTSGVIWLDELNLDVPSQYLNPIKGFHFYSNNNQVSIYDSKVRCCVLDVRGFYQYLARLAIKNGTEIMLRSKAIELIRDDGKVVGIKVKKSREELIVKSKLVIDASGFSSIIASKIFGTWKRYGVGAEYECYADNFDHESIFLMVGSNYSPAGYAWIFPVNRERVRIGVGIARPESNLDPLLMLDKLLKNKPRPIDSIKNIEPIELHYGFVPNDGLRGNLVDDGLMIVGDAAGIANPLVLEGIRYALRFGYIAGEVGKRSLAYDSKKEYLLEYEDSVKKLKKVIDNALRVQKRWLGLDDEGWDKEIDIIKDMDVEDLVDFLKASFSKGRMLRLALNHPKLIARELFRMVID